MPRPLPKLGLHKPTGQYRVIIAGRHFYLGRDRAEARRKYDALIVAWKSGRPVEKPGEAMLLASLADEYRIDCERRGIVWDGHKKGAMRWLANTRHWHLPANLFDCAALIEVFTINNTARPAMNRKAYAAWTLQSRKKAVIAMFKRGAVLGLVDPDVWRQLSALSGRDLGIPTTVRKPKPANPLHVDRCIAVAPRDVADMLTVHRWTGMRPGEVCRLTWAEIDDSGPVWVYRPEQHKTAHKGGDRAIFLGPRAQAALMKYRGKSGTIFVSPESVPWTTDTYGKMVYHLCAKAKVARWTPNQLRHLRLSEVRKHAGIEAAQVIGGHAHLSTTETYAERQHELARRVAGETG